MSARTLIDRLARRAASDGERVALRLGDEDITLGHLWRRSGRCGRALASGRRPGERVVIALPNGDDFFAAFLGAQRAGLVPVPVFPRASVERVLAAGAGCGARVAVFAPAAVAAEGEARGRAARAAGVDAVDVAALEAAAAGAGGAIGGRRLPSPAANDLAYLQYTSGSTGEAKAVQITHGGLMTNIEQMTEGLGITGRDVFVSWLPVYHDMGLVLMSLVPFCVGASLVLLPATLRSLRPWLDAIARHRGTFVAAPDFAYRLLLRRVGDGGRHDLSSLRVALNAAEPVRAATLRRFEAVFDLARVMLPAYGLAEATVGVSAGAPGTAPRVDSSGRVSVGRPFPRIEIAILGADGRAATGEVGEIAVKSAANTRGYFDDAEATAALLWRDGFVRTGDLGYVDERGELFVVGRRKNLIIQAGRNIAPREVEEVAEALPFVRHSAAVGIDRGGVEGEQVYLFAEVSGRSAAADRRRWGIEIVRRLHGELGLRPGRVYLTRPRTLPRTDNGKIRYGELRRRYLDGELRRGGHLLYPDY